MTKQAIPSFWLPMGHYYTFLVDINLWGESVTPKKNKINRILLSVMNVLLSINCGLPLFSPRPKVHSSCVSSEFFLQLLIGEHAIQLNHLGFNCINCMNNKFYLLYFFLNGKLTPSPNLSNPSKNKASPNSRNPLETRAK